MKDLSGDGHVLYLDCQAQGPCDTVVEFRTRLPFGKLDKGYYFLHLQVHVLNCIAQSSQNK